MTTFTIRYTTFNRAGELVTKEKTFKTEAAMQKWLDKDDNGVVEVLAFGNGF